MGVLLYRLLSGRLPFDADTVTAVIFKHVYEHAGELCSVVPEVPRKLSAVVERLMAKEPAERFPSADEVIRELSQVNSDTDARFNPGMMVVNPADEKVSASIAAPSGAREKNAAPQTITTATSQLSASRSHRQRGLRRLVPIAAVVAILLLVAYSAFSIWMSRARAPDIESSSKQVQIPNSVVPWPHVYPRDAVEFEGHHYKLYQKLKIPWVDAKSECEQAGGHLAMPDSAEKAEFVAKLKKKMAVWVGAYRESDRSEDWKWLSGESLAPELVLFSGSPGHWWMATSADESKIGFVPRKMDGTIRDDENRVLAGLNTNIHGYICEWDK
jgi:hypothetical protein